MDDLPYSVVKIVVHRDLVETLAATWSIKAPPRRFAPGDKVVITEGPQLDQEGFIQDIHDDGTALVHIGTKLVSCNNAHSIV